jgi:ankyrin repeat protein
MLAAGMAVDSPVCDGVPALHLASHLGNVAMIRALLDAGADVNLISDHPKPTDHQRRTALIAACEGALNDTSPRQRKEAIMLLLDQGANYAPEGAAGSTAAHRILYSGLTNSDSAWVDLLSTVLKRLFDSGLHPDRPDFSGMGLLHIAARVPTHKSILEMLFDRGANPNMAMKSGSRPLHLAASLSSAAVTSLFISKGADPDATDLAGSTPLFNANNGEICRCLLGAGANLEHRNNAGLTPLMHQVDALQGNFASPSILAMLEAGAETDVRNQTGESLAQLVTRKNLGVVAGAISARAARAAMQGAMPRAPGAARAR